FAKKLSSGALSAPIVPWNKCDRGSETALVHLSQQSLVVQISIRLLQQRIIDDEIGEAVSAVPAMALENPLQEHRWRQQAGEVLNHIHSAIRLFLKIDDISACQDERGAPTVYQESQKWQPCDGYERTEAAGRG